MRPRARGAAENLRRAAGRLPGVRQAARSQARLRRGLPAQGQRLVRDRLPRRRQAGEAAKRRQVRRRQRPATNVGDARTRSESKDRSRSPSATARARDDRRPRRLRHRATAAKAGIHDDRPRSAPSRSSDEALSGRRAAGLGAARHHDLGAALPRDDARPDAAAASRRRCGPKRCSASHSRASACVLSFVILLVTGVIAANFFGQRLIRLWEALLGRIPVVKSIYSSSSRSATRCCPIRARRSARRCWSQFPHQARWTIAFLTGTPAAAVVDASAERVRQRLRADHAEPDGGYFVMVPRVAGARARHDGRRSAEVHHLDGRRRAARQPSAAEARPRRSPSPPRPRN